MKYVPDTNALIYLLDYRLAQPFPYGQYAYSVITEIELLSWPKMQQQTESACRELLYFTRVNIAYLSWSLAPVAARGERGIWSVCEAVAARETRCQRQRLQ